MTITGIVVQKSDKTLIITELNSEYPKVYKVSNEERKISTIKIGDTVKATVDLRSGSDSFPPLYEAKSIRNITSDQSQQKAIELALRYMNDIEKDQLLLISEIQKENSFFLINISSFNDKDINYLLEVDVRTYDVRER